MVTVYLYLWGVQYLEFKYQDASMDPSYRNIKPADWFSYSLNILATQGIWFATYPHAALLAKIHDHSEFPSQSSVGYVSCSQSRAGGGGGNNQMTSPVGPKLKPIMA